jgi:hypothetical protein
MRYLVVLRLDSPMGIAYSTGNNDGIVTVGKESYPALDCIEIQPDAPHYLFVTREIKKPVGNKAGPHTQTLYIPHFSVAFIVCYDVSVNPIGFVRNQAA